MRAMEVTLHRTPCGCGHRGQEQAELFVTDWAASEAWNPCLIARFQLRKCEWL